MGDLKPDVVSKLWKHMAAFFGAQVTSKGSAVEMQAASVVLGRMGIVDREDFMSRFATTVGRHVYIPFVPGEAEPTWSLLAQAETCVHEMHHIIQYQKLGAIMFYYQYVCSRARRATLEAEAYRTNVEMRYRLTGELRDTDSLAELLRSYGVRDIDVEVAKKVLRSSVPTIRAGGVTSLACKVATDFLRREGAIA